jgi:8-hydroxy-5-deazaflavin:NADPH oxidoreductase
VPDERASSPTPQPVTRVGILGGTGKLGAGLALRWAAAGIEVTIGSRDPARAASVAADLCAKLPEGSATLDGAANAVAADRPVVVASIPTEGADTLVGDLADVLAGRILVSALSPLAFDARGPRPGEVGAASAAELLATCAPDASVVGGFHTVSAVTLRRTEDPLDEDVLLCGDDDAAVAQVAALVDDHLDGARAVHCGPLRLSASLEALTAVLISINKRHRAHAGLHVTRLGPPPAR